MSKPCFLTIISLRILDCWEISTSNVHYHWLLRSIIANRVKPDDYMNANCILEP